MIESHADGQDHGDSDGVDVLGLYLEMARARLTPARFEAVVRAAQATCGLLAQGHEALVAAPEEEGFTVELQREYLGLLAVMITGSLDHRVVEVPGPAGGTGLAVVQPTAAVPKPAEGEDDSSGARVDKQPDGILRDSA